MNIHKPGCLCTRCQMVSGNFAKGLVHSAETKAKISKAMLGVPKSETAKKNISAGRCGCKLSTETRAKISQAILGTKHSVLTNKKIANAFKGRLLSEEWKKKIGATHAAYWRDPDYIKTHANVACKGYVSGYFKSMKNCCNIFFQSTYELRAYMLLEHDDSVQAFGRCMFSIPYIYKGTGRRYIPDILVEQMDGKKFIIEVKPEALVAHPETITKRVVGEQYCKENCMTYVIWTERDLGIKL